MNRSEQTKANDWQERLLLIEDLMRDMSRHTDPQAMVRSYGERVQQMLPIGRRISLSRRGLSYPHYRITRSTTWTEEVNPWKEKDRLPLLAGGLLAELIYGDRTAVLDDLFSKQPDAHTATAHSVMHLRRRRIGSTAYFDPLTREARLEVWPGVAAEKVQAALDCWQGNHLPNNTSTGRIQISSAMACFSLSPARSRHSANRITRGARVVASLS